MHMHLPMHILIWELWMEDIASEQRKGSWWWKPVVPTHMYRNHPHSHAHQLLSLSLSIGIECLHSMDLSFKALIASTSFMIISSHNSIRILCTCKKVFCEINNRVSYYMAISIGADPHGRKGILKAIM